MARPSKLSDKQWAEIEKRLSDGEIPAILAKEYGIDRAAITRKFSQQLRNIKAIASQIVTTDKLLKSLPITQQVQVSQLVDKLKSISTHLACSAEYGAMTSHRLALIANQQLDKIDESAPLEENMDALKIIRAMTTTSNEAAQTGLNLLNANKDSINNMNKSDGKAKVYATPLDELI